MCLDTGNRICERFLLLGVSADGVANRDELRELSAEVHRFRST